jgi:hypothetical protein
VLAESSDDLSFEIVSVLGDTGDVPFSFDSLLVTNVVVANQKEDTMEQYKV